MCWINWYNFIDSNIIQLMNKAIHHRGPDDEWFFVDGKNQLTIGQVRLSIIDRTDAGHQPMFYDKELWASSSKFNQKNISQSLL